MFNLLIHLDIGHGYAQDYISFSDSWDGHSPYAQ